MWCGFVSTAHPLFTEYSNHTYTYCSIRACFLHNSYMPILIWRIFKYKLLCGWELGCWYLCTTSVLHHACSVWSWHKLGWWLRCDSPLTCSNVWVWRYYEDIAEVSYFHILSQSCNIRIDTASRDYMYFMKTESAISIHILDYILMVLPGWKASWYI